MDVKGAKALSERLAEAARNVDPPIAKAVGRLARARVLVHVAGDPLAVVVQIPTHGANELAPQSCPTGRGELCGADDL